MESSLEPSEGTSQSHISKILQDPAVPLVQRGKLDSLPKKHRHPKKGIKAKRMKKRKKKEKTKAQCPPSLPIPLAPSQSEEGATVDKIPAIVSAQDDPAFHHEDRVQRQQDKSPCVMDLECQIQSCDLSQEPGPSSPTVTSLASPPLCFGHFLSCVRQTFSKSKKRKLCRRKSSNQAEAGGDAKVPRPDRLSSLGPNKV
ncbi:hypothetical protein SUZIE_194825 [Sciurus carolinensis]|uniref:Uncharacterized protein n=1 Tax=Sciurus carolinensis TaxID=30640 RepID=A0AA41NCA3_SCICA|nr:uncharacterized protein LOC124994854 [Sciurus carolinensis]MBZ3887778.1 hypothetical protein [Sciurus carolinensis]